MGKDKLNKRLGEESGAWKDLQPHVLDLLNLGVTARPIDRLISGIHYQCTSKAMMKPELANCFLPSTTGPA